MANQKFGMAMPTWLRPITPRRRAVVARRRVDAEREHGGGQAMASTANGTLTASRSSISSDTGEL